MKETPHNNHHETLPPLQSEGSNHTVDVLDLTGVTPVDVDEASIAVDGFNSELKRIEAEQAAATRHEALALGGIKADETIGDQKLSAGLIEARGYVRRAPRLSEQLADDSRTKPFKFYRKLGNVNGDAGESTEIKGLREYHEYLVNFIGVSADTHKPTANHWRRMEQALGMLEHTTFIGEKEYREAAESLGKYWKQFLDEDPDRVLCVLAEVGELERYKEAGVRKSDHYLRDQILQTFTDDELERYSGRIVGRVGGLPADPTNVKIVLLDDWTISGMQMRGVYGAFADHPSFRRYINADSVEVNLLVGSEGHLQNGLKIDPYQDDSPVIRVRSHFMSHHAEGAEKEHKGYVSGLHSSVNYDFKIPVQGMATVLRKLKKPQTTPALIWVTDAYREPQRIQITSDRLIRVADDREVAYESR